MIDGILPVYNREHLRRELGSFLWPPSHWKPSPSYVLVGTLRASHARGASFFVIRVGHRKPVQIKSRQKSIPGDRNNIYPRKQYLVSHYSYSVYSYHWETAQLDLVAGFTTRREADKHLHTIQ